MRKKQSIPIYMNMVNLDFVHSCILILGRFAKREVSMNDDVTDEFIKNENFQ